MNKEYGRASPQVQVGDAASRAWKELFIGHERVGLGEKFDTKDSQIIREFGLPSKFIDP